MTSPASTTTPNPYVGTDNESTWAQGYSYGQQNPTDSELNAPSMLTSDAAQIWREGALAGQQDVQVNPPVNPSQPSGPGELVGPAVEVGHWGWDIADGAAVAGATGALMLGLLVELIIAEEPPEGQATDPAALAQWFKQKCGDANITDAYMAYCDNTQANHTGGNDALFSAGWWHGPMHVGDADSATNEATAHLQAEPASAGQVGVMHYATATPNDLDMSTIGFQPQ
jgi:hypothetical protein